MCGCRSGHRAGRARHGGRPGHRFAIAGNLPHRAGELPRRRSRGGLRQAPGAGRVRGDRDYPAPDAPRCGGRIELAAAADGGHPAPHRGVPHSLRRLEVRPTSDVYLLSAHLLVRRLSGQLAEDGQPGIGETERMFARDWYLLLVAVQHGRADVGWSRAYLEEALKSFPKDPHLTVALGIGSRDALRSQRRIRRPTSTPPAGIPGSRQSMRRTSFARRFAAWSRRWRWRRSCSKPGCVSGGCCTAAASSIGPRQELEAARQLASQDELKYLALLFSGMVEAARGQLRASRQLLHRRPSPPPERAGGRHRQGRSGLPSRSSGRSGGHHPGDVAADEEGRPVVGLQYRASSGTSSIGSRWIRKYVQQ